MIRYIILIFFISVSVYAQDPFKSEPSPDGASLPGKIVDDGLHTWELFGGRIYRDSTYSAKTGGVNFLLKHGGKIYQRNTAGNWYLWDDATSVWTVSSDPSKPPPDPDPPPDPPPDPTPPPTSGSPKNCAEARARAQVVFCQDFDKSPTGDWGMADLRRDFPGRIEDWIAGPTGAPKGVNSSRGFILSDSSAMYGNSLRSKLPRNMLGSDSGLIFTAPIGERLDEAYLGYWVRFDPKFPDIRGGKLPGFTAGVTDSGTVSPCCGRIMERGRGFSTRMMFIRRNFQNYIYWIDNNVGMKGQHRYGGPTTGAIHPWVPGRWYFVEHHVKLNSPAGARNGLIEIWIDGRRVTHIPNTRIRGDGQNFGITSIMFNNYLGGGDPTWHSPVDTYNYFDLVVVSRSRIGG